MVMAATEFRVVEEMVFWTAGSRVCPSPELCDLQPKETYEKYVARHMGDHSLPKKNPKTKKIWTLEESERNLGVWCLYFFHKYIQGNTSLRPYPCWEDAEFLSNGVFSEKDLETKVPWEQRTFRLPPAAERSPGVYKRMRKLTKVRETQKTSWAKAKVTFEHLHAYFIKGHPNFRVLILSATSALGRDNYVEVFKQMWATHEKLMELYGADAYLKTDRQCTRSCSTELLGKCEHRKRRLCLLPLKNAFSNDGIRLRWTIGSKKQTGMGIIAVFCAGMETATRGRRWDLVIVDDPCIEENSGTHEQRQKVKRKGADTRKQLSAIGELVWLNTPEHGDDASAQVDNEFADEFHIMYRPARWSRPDGTFEFYWEYSATCSVCLHGSIDRFDESSATSTPVRHDTVSDHSFTASVVWPRERIATEERQSDFYTQVLLRTRNALTASFDENDFEMLDVENAPIEIRFGLGRPLTEDEKTILAAAGKRVIAMNFVDSAGKPEQSRKGCRSAIAGERFDAVGNIIITHIQYGQWSTEQELDSMWASCVRNQPEFIEYEISGAHEKWVLKGIADWQGKKSMEHGRPILMPIRKRYAVGGHDEQDRRIEKMQPYVKAGRVKILKDAGSTEDIARLKREFHEWPGAEQNDGPDAVSRFQSYIEPLSFEEIKQKEAEKEHIKYEPFDPETGTGGSLSIPLHIIERQLEELEAEKDPTWGTVPFAEYQVIPDESKDSVPSLTGGQ